MKAKILTIYLDWVNNWLTTPRMAEYYGMDTVKLERIISIGRRIHYGN